jgi:BirA family biotin operon repressor/biotin-[acetyl-CoA-carboxylase] ligase
MATPYSLHVREEVTSTQEVARELYRGTPVLVVAARQTHGRGRLGSTWLTAPRALATSLAIEPPGSPGTWPPVPLMAGLAAARATGDPRVGLKWPNDLMKYEAKIGGVLSEVIGALLVVGLGVNLWWPEAPAGMGALEADDPGPGAAAHLAGSWAVDLIGQLRRGPGWELAEYQARCVTVGRQVRWEPAGSGRAVAVDEDGALVVERGGSRLRLTAGEVHHLR